MTDSEFPTRKARDVWLACMLEASAKKPGNVHPEAEFADLQYADFVRSARVIAPLLSQTTHAGIGPTIFNAVEKTRAEVGRNTNLGIILLLAPLCAVEGPMTREAVSRVLNGLTVNDSCAVYRAISVACAGGMGEVEDQDLQDVPTEPLVECMRLAEDRDLIAKQYVNGFAGVFQMVDEFDANEFHAHFRGNWEVAVIKLHLRIMSTWPDTLIQRKLGSDVAQQSSKMAARVLGSGWPDSRESVTLMSEFDAWLRTEGHQRNPGTSADMVAAVLFVALQRDIIDAPESFRDFS